MIAGRNWSELFWIGRSSGDLRFATASAAPFILISFLILQLHLHLPSSSSRQSNFSYRVAQPIELKEIIKATSNFQTGIGHGILCDCFKAWIDEHTLIASKPGSGTGMAVTVKRWYNNMERHEEWLKEIDYLVQLHHPNLVDLVGYCTEEGNMILVYEFMPEGNLNDRLFTRIHHQPLPWAARIKVALDVARGLSYLHDREIPVIHRDFKSANIYLDAEWNAKLSNYCYGRDDHSPGSTTQVFFALGYTAPEYSSKGRLTTKSMYIPMELFCLNYYLGFQHQI